MLVDQQTSEKEKCKKDNDTASQSEDNQQVPPLNSQQLKVLQKKFTSLDKLHNYFDFFLKNPESSQFIFPSYRMRNLNQKTTIYQDFQLHRFLQNVKKILLQKSIQKKSSEYQFQLDKKSSEFLTNFQKNHADKLTQDAIKSKRFKKTKQFSDQIIIHQINPSKHHQVIRMQVQLLWFKTSILILNQLEKSSLQEFAYVSDSGSFGNVYFVQFLNQKYCIKSYSLENRIKDVQKNVQHDDYHTDIFCKAFIAILTQYFFLLLFSQLEIGPKVQTIGGFDIVIYENSIEFATEICDQLRNSEEDRQGLKESLFKMHMLQIVHRDIKPNNIMFSHTFKKNVFIDFGGSQVLKETLGEKTMTQFIGTASYCTDEVFELLSSKANFVDLYYNDIYGLKKSISQTSNTPFLIDEGKESIINRIDQTVDFMNSEGNSDFELIEIKSSSFCGDEETFEFLWSYLKFKYSNRMKEIQSKILQFFKELKPNEFLRRFYHTKITESTKKLQQFSDLSIIFKNESCELLSYLSNDIRKAQAYNKYKSYFKKLQIQFGNFTQQQQQIQKSLINKITIKKSLEYFYEYFSRPILNGSIEDENFIKLCIITVNFCCISENSFQISFSQKIEASKSVLLIIKKVSRKSLQKLNLLFECPENSFKEISTFYQYFLYNVFHLVPTKYRSEMMIKAVSSLCLIGLPTQQKKSLKGILHIILTSDRTLKKEESKDPKKQEQEERIEKIVLFWQCKIIFLLFGHVFYRNKSTNQKDIDNTDYNPFWKKQIEIMISRQDQQTDFFSLNYAFYIKVFREYLEFNEKSCKQLLHALMSPKFRQMQVSSKLISRWKKLMQIILCYFSNAYKMTKSIEMRKLIEKEQIFESTHNKCILPYLVFFYCDEIQKTHFQSHFILNKIDEIINQKKISLRFQLQQRLIIALQRRNINKLSDILDIIKRQIDIVSFQKKNVQFVSRILLIIQRFFEEYLTESPDFNQQCQQIVKRLRDVVIIAMETGKMYFEKICNEGKLNTIETLKFGEFNVKEFQNQITLSRFRERFALSLIFVGQIFNEMPNLRLLNNKFMIQNQQITSNQIKLPQIYNTFIAKLKSNQAIFDYGQLWMDAIQYDQQFQQKVKANQPISMMFVSIFLQRQRNNNEIMRTSKVTEILFDEIRSEQFQDEADSNKPNFFIAFGFFLTKLIKTNYELRWCHQLIKMHKISVKINLLEQIALKQQAIRFIFNSYIYTQKTYSEMQSFLWNLTETLKKIPSRKLVQQIKKAFDVIFWCNCNDCFPRKAQNWSPQKFTKYLLTSINYSKVKQNPYMSLVYFYNMRKKILQARDRKRFIIYILKSIPYLTYDVKDAIFPDIYQQIYAAIQPFPFSNFLNISVNSKLLKILKFDYKQRNNKKIKRYLYLSGQFIKNQPSNLNTLDQLVEARLIREHCLSGYECPPLVRNNFLAKLRRYHEVKENYRKSQKIAEIVHTKKFLLHWN